MKISYGNMNFSYTTSGLLFSFDYVVIKLTKRCPEILGISRDFLIILFKNDA